MSRAKTQKLKSPEAYRSIGEAAAEVGLQPHVLRYWEGKFPRHIKPVKRRDGRRMFRPGDMSALKAVQLLVHERGMTLKGARTLLAEQGVETVLSGMATITSYSLESGSEGPARQLQKTLANAFEGHPSGANSNSENARLKSVLHEMNHLKARLDAARLRSAA